MQNPVASLLFILAMLTGPCPAADYPERTERTQSAGNHVWHIDPDKGNDGNPVTAPSTAWKSMAPANRLIMARGDTLVIHPGEHAVSLALMGEGSKQAPVTIRFMPGRHIFKHGALMTGKPQISNTNDAPNEPKAMAIRLMEAKNIRLEGKPGATDILLEGKAIFVCMEHAENVSLNGLGFDYLHPTMGEFLVTEVEGDTMKATLHGRVFQNFRFRIRHFPRPFRPRENSHQRIVSRKNQHYVQGRLTNHETGPILPEPQYPEGLLRLLSIQKQKHPLE